MDEPQTMKIRCHVTLLSGNSMHFFTDQLWLNRANPGCQAFIYAPDLFACGQCRERCAQSLIGEPSDNGLFEIELRCPGCGATNHILGNQQLVTHLNEQRAVQTQALKDSVKRLVPEMLTDAEQMTLEVERLITALDAGQICPEDF